jgi:hypothetical protein
MPTNGSLLVQKLPQTLTTRSVNTNQSSSIGRHPSASSMESVYTEVSGIHNSKLQSDKELKMLYKVFKEKINLAHFPYLKNLVAAK